MIEVNNRKFVENWHHKVLADLYTEVFKYKYEFININIPPRHTKTEFLINSIAQGLANNPYASYIYITGSDSLRAETSLAIKKIMKSDIYQYFWNREFTISQDNKNIWRLKEGGGLMTASILGTITGFGAGILRTKEARGEMFDGFIACDDLNKIADASKMNERNENINEVIAHTLLSRKNSSDTPIINIQQRAGLNDATEKFKSLYPENKKNKYLVIPVRDERGEALWSFMMNEDQIRDKEINPETAYIFDTQYMQQPSSKIGTLFNKRDLQFFELKDIKKEEIDAIYSFVDTADRGKDYFAAPFGYLIYGKIYIMDVIYNQLLLLANQELLVSKTKEHNLTKGVIESNKEGSYFVGNVNKELENRTYTGIFSTLNKEARIISYADYIKKYFVFRSDFELNSDYYLFMKHLERYLRGVTNQQDGAPDSLAGLAKFCKVLKIF